MRGLLIVLAVWSVSGVSLAEARPPVRACTLKPPSLIFALPKAGIQPSDAELGPCRTVSEEAGKGAATKSTVERGVDGVHRLRACSVGPSGSGRYWTVSFEVTDGDEAARGICLKSTTLGWRTIGRFRPLEWVDDIDADGRSEFVLWGSFALGGEDAPARFGLVGWVYKVYGTQLVLDPNKTRMLAKELSAAYRRPTKGSMAADRKKAAAALEALAGGRCTLEASEAVLPKCE